MHVHLSIFCLPVCLLQLISSSGRVTAYLPNLRAAVQHFRGFASYDKYVEKEDIEPGINKLII